jgi:hypothetical protein
MVAMVQNEDNSLEELALVIALLRPNEGRCAMKGITVRLLLVLAVAAAAPQAAAQTAPRSPTVAFRSELPGTYELRRVRFWVDGVLRYDAAAPFNASLAPGQHVVSVAANYRLHDPIFPYVNAYTIELRSAERIPSDPSRRTLLRAVERGGVTTPIDRRARMVWQ